MKRSEIIVTIIIGFLFVGAIVGATIYIMNNTVIHNMGN
jgi:uncharacterized membrane protein